MQKVLVTGASGFVGKMVCQSLAGRGMAVSAAVRHGPPVAAPSGQGPTAQVGVGNIDGHTSWAAALSGCSSVIHLAARAHVLRDTNADPLAAFRETNVAATLRLAHCAVEAGVRRLVFVSSIGVNGDRNDRPFTETDAVQPTEAYAVSKLEAEIALRDYVATTAMELVIVRPPLVYGPECPGNFLRLLKLVDSGVPLPFGAIESKRSYIGVWNLADFLATCMDHQNAAGALFLVSDMDDITLPDLLRALALGMGKQTRLWRCDPAWLRRCAALVGKAGMLDKICANLTVSAAHAHAALGWTPPVSLAQGLHLTGQWYAQR